ncbi:MAG: hypothetical protein JRE40_07965 [Deltaproteobacteria bacterium]|nr:hypothetical protein [Deltaproteobacteria bacterium]
MSGEIWRCKVCGEEVESGQKDHLREHIRRGELWHAPCRINGQPCFGHCTDENQYKRCPMRDNLRCWWDGVLIEV